MRFIRSAKSLFGGRVLSLSFTFLLFQLLYFHVVVCATGLQAEDNNGHHHQQYLLKADESGNSEEQSEYDFGDYGVPSTEINVGPRGPEGPHPTQITTIGSYKPVSTSFLRNKPSYFEDGANIVKNFNESHDNPFYNEDANNYSKSESDESKENGTDDDNDNDSALSHSSPIGPPPNCVYTNNDRKNTAGYCQKGERGERGRRGKPGTAGSPASPGIPGAPGLSIEGAKGQKGEPCLFDIQAWAAENRKHPDTEPVEKPSQTEGDKTQIKGLYEIVPGAIVFKHRSDLKNMFDFSRIGTIVYIKDEEKFYGKVEKGWREIMMGSKIVSFDNDEPPLMYSDSPVANDEKFKKSRRSKTSTSAKKPINQPHLRIAALNEPWNGDLNGVKGADFKCSSEAKEAKIDEEFRAFITHNSTASIKETVEFSARKLPILNLRGDFLFRSWNSLFRTSGVFRKAPTIYAFNGRNVATDTHWPHKRIWHGSELQDKSSKNVNCKSWNSDRFYNMGYASDLLLHGSLLLAKQKVDCRQNLIVLCIEIRNSSKKY